MHNREKTFILVSPFCFQNEHTTFEAWFIQQLLSIHNWKIYFFWEINHCNSLGKYFPGCNINFIPISPLWWRLFFGLRTLFLVFIFSFFKKNIKIIFLSFEHPHILFLVSLFFSGTHGCLHSGTAISPLLRFIKKIGLYFFSFRNEYFVLWRWIYKNLEVKKKVNWIYYPLFKYENTLPSKNLKKLIVVFGGSRYKYKFVNQDLEKLITDILANKWFDFLVLWKWDASLDMIEYHEILKNAYLSVFISSPMAYKLRCSGSFFDSINAWLPIVWFQCEMSTDIEDTFGKIWFFTSDTEEWFLKQLLFLLQQSEEQFSTIRRNLCSARDWIYRDNIARMRNLFAQS